MQKVYLEIDAKTGGLKAKLNTSSGDIKTWSLEAEKSGKKAAKGFDETTKATDRLGSSLSNMQGVLTSVFTTAAVIAAGKAIIKTADSVAEMEGRLKVATKTTAEYNAAQSEVIEIANRSFATIGDTVNLYSRLTVALRETELAQRDIFNITETVNKAFTVSGATTVEAANAIRQLSQGIQSGVLRGEEYNAITEQGDRIVQALADSLGKTRGELRAMANDGKLSAETVTGALLDQASTIAAEYEQFPLTVARSITRMSNAWTEYIANSETAREVSQNVAEAIVFLAENLDTIIDGALLATQVIISLAGAKGLKALAASFAVSTAATKAATVNTYSYAAATGVARTATLALGSAFKKVGSILKANALGIAIFGGIELIQFLGDLTDKLEGMPTAVDRVNDAFENGISLEGLRAAGAEVENLKTEITALDEKLENTKGFKGVSDSANDLQANVYAAAFSVRGITKDLEDANYTLTKATWAKRLSETVDTATGVFNAFKGVYVELTEEIDESNKTIDKWIASTAEQTQKLQNANKVFGEGKAALIQLEAAQLKATTTSKKYHKEIDKVTAAKIRAVEVNEELRAQEKELNEATSLAIELAEEYLEVTDPVAAAETVRAESVAKIKLALDAGTISQEQYTAAIAGASLGVTEAENGLKKYEDRVRTADDVLEDLGVTTKALDADVQLLTLALDNAITANDMENAELYAQALERIAEQAEDAAESLNNVRGINAQGGLNNDASFSGLLAQGLTLKDIFASMSQSMEEGAAGMANAINVGLQGIQALRDIWDSTEGQDDAGRILQSVNTLAETGALGQTAQAIAQLASTINALTGGRLFGTSFETTGSAANFNIGPGGVSGNTETYQERERSLFRGTERQTIVEALTGEALSVLLELFDNVETGIETLARGLGTTVPDLIAGAFNQEFDAEGNVIAETSTILGRTYSETFAEFGARLLAENLIAVLDQAIPGIESAVNASGIAEVYRSQGADALLDFATFAAAAVEDLQQSNAILGSLAEITAISEELSHAGESLLETYERLRGSVELTDEALDILGVSLELGAEEYIRFAAEITDAAGGLENARDLWAGFISSFYDPEELQALRLSEAQNNSSQSLAELDLKEGTTLAEFREAFTSVFSELTPAEVVTWLEAGNALAEYNALLAEQVEAQLAANTALDDAVNSVNDDILELLRSDFQNTLAAIESQERDTIDALNDLAIAAGQAGLSEEELARVHLRTSIQTEQAIGRLRNAAESLVNELYGDSIDQRISELEELQSNSITSVGNAAENTYQRQLQLIQRIRDVIDSTLISENLSPLTRGEQLTEGVSQFQELIEAANNGDLDAQGQLPALYQELLGIGRDVFGAGQGYQDLYNQLTGLLGTVEATGGPSSPQTVIMLPSAELTALYAERDARLAEQTANERLELATQLSSYLSDLAGALNVPLVQIAEEIGVTMDALATDLGVNLEEITVETVNQLANMANLLGVNLSEITESLGEDIGAELGNLAEAQSLLNDALEDRINSLPDGIQGTLGPLLEAVETAADGKERDRALLALENATAELPIEYRNLLAPFFNNINPVSELQEQVLIANRMEAAAEERRLLLSRQLETLTEVRNNLREQNTFSGLPSYAVGSTYIPSDQVANIHKGELIMTAQEAAIMRKYFGAGGNVGGSSGTMDVLLRELIGVVRQGNERTNNSLQTLNENKLTRDLYTNRLQFSRNSTKNLDSPGSCGGGGFI